MILKLKGDDVVAHILDDFERSLNWNAYETYETRRRDCPYLG